MNLAVTAKHIEHQGPLEIISILRFVVDSAENSHQGINWIIFVILEMVIGNLFIQDYQELILTMRVFY